MYKILEYKFKGALDQSEEYYFLTVYDIKWFIDAFRLFSSKLKFGTLRIDCTLRNEETNEILTVTIYEEKSNSWSGGENAEMYYQVFVDDAPAGRYSTRLDANKEWLETINRNGYVANISDLSKFTVELKYEDCPLFRISNGSTHYDIYQLEDALPYLKDLPYGIGIKFDNSADFAYLELGRFDPCEFYEVYKRCDLDWSGNLVPVPGTTCFTKDYQAIRMALYNKVLPKIHTLEWQNEEITYMVHCRIFDNQAFIEHECMGED